MAVRKTHIFRFTRKLIPATLINTRIWWNWQTRYFEVVVPQGMQVFGLTIFTRFIFLR